MQVWSLRVFLEPLAEERVVQVEVQGWGTEQITVEPNNTATFGELALAAYQLLCPNGPTNIVVRNKFKLVSSDASLLKVVLQPVGG